MKEWSILAILNILLPLFLLSLTQFFATLLVALWVSDRITVTPLLLLVSILLLFVIGSSVHSAYQLLWLARELTPDNNVHPSTTLSAYRSSQPWLRRIIPLPPVPLEGISNWKQWRNIWWDYKLEDTNYVFSAIFRNARSRRQNSKHQVAVYHSLHEAIENVWEDWLKTGSAEEPDHGSSSRVSRLIHSDVPHVLQEFEDEFNISHNTRVIARLTTFSTIYWTILRQTWDVSHRQSKVVDATLDTLTNILPAPDQLYDNLPWDIYGSDAVVSFLNVITAIAGQGVIVNHCILQAIVAVVQWASHSEEQRDSVASALKMLLEKLSLFDTYNQFDESEASFCQRRRLHNTKSSSILTPFLRQLSQVTGDGGWDDFYLKIFLKIHDTIQLIHAPPSIQNKVPKSTLTYMDLLPERSLYVSKATFVYYMAVIRDQTTAEGLKRFLGPFPGIIKGMVCQEDMPLDLAKIVDETLFDLLRIAAGNTCKLFKDEGIRVLGIICQFQQELDLQILDPYPPRLWEIRKVFGERLDNINTLRPPDQLLQVGVTPVSSTIPGAVPEGHQARLSEGDSLGQEVPPYKPQAQTIRKKSGWYGNLASRGNRGTGRSRAESNKRGSEPTDDIVNKRTRTHTDPTILPELITPGPALTHPLGPYQSTLTGSCVPNHQ